jgi:L-threonylcarbamoyladenylate synthase
MSYIVGKNIKDFAEYLEQDNVIAYPTETIYGLAVNAFKKESVNYLAKLKGRNDSKAYILLVKDMKMLSNYAEANNEDFEFIKSIWPAPVSFILRAKPTLPDWLKDEKGKTCFRMSSSKFVQEVFNYYDRPIISTSANPTGYVPAEDPWQIAGYFMNEEKLVIYADEHNDLGSGTPSTIIDLTTVKPTVIRKGGFNIVF